MDMKGDATSSSSSSRVCVMDGTGCVGSTLVRRLLLRGYTVHAALQTHDDEMMKSFKRKYAEEISSSRLRVFQTDLLDYHSILEAVKGCYGLFYTFEPPYDYASYDEFMGEIEVRAAHNVVEACTHTTTIDKVVFTSSATAVVWARGSLHPLDERNWSDISLCKNLKVPKSTTLTMLWRNRAKKGRKNNFSKMGGKLFNLHYEIYPFILLSIFKIEQKLKSKFVPV
ncbi:unnamed protein product [Cuscuta campestris]|uniref:3-beta hydroxysteroid dehydrogenase/isomerase domain-containing protein n=1 Tax=Cuscuta campestris TaxID=132261 RepID=A0A484KGJ3_9ASTE|nr:unnamed protein product [Cuscuta campestris]